MGARRRARERVLQALYACHASRGFPDPSADAIRAVLSELRERFPNESDESAGPADAAREDLPYAVELLTGVISRLDQVDRTVAAASSDWRPDRMDAVDLCVIRIAVFELLFVKNVPSAVSINEAVELARKYGGEHSPPFVNGVLDRVRRDLEEGRF